MSGLEIKINDFITSKLKDIAQSLPNEANILIDDIGNIYRNSMRDESPHVTGQLKANHLVEYLSKYAVLIYSDIPYFVYVVGGTKPHVIKAKKAKALGPISMSASYLGVSKSGYGFFRQVQHPGTKPNDYPSRAFKSSESKISMRINRFYSEVFGS